MAYVLGPFSMAASPSTRGHQPQGQHFIPGMERAVKASFGEEEEGVVVVNEKLK